MVKIKQTKYSAENPEVWVPTEKEEAEEQIPFLLKVFRKYGKGKSILDVGCGKGIHTDLLAEKGYKCLGIEPHPKMVEYARKNCSKVDYEVGSMQDLNHKNKFNIVMCIFSTIVFNKSNEEAEKTFSNFYKALKNKGLLVIETYNAISWLANNSFKNKFINIDREKNQKTIVKEWINTNNQSYISEREYYRLKDNKKLGSFTKESRMFFPLELKYFLEKAGFKVITMFSADSLSKMTFKDKELNKRRLLVVAKKLNTK